MLILVIMVSYQKVSMEISVYYPCNNGWKHGELISIKKKSFTLLDIFLENLTESHVGFLV